MDRRIAVVTGAANGIGRAVASVLVAEGSWVLGVDADSQALAIAATELGDTFVPFAADVSSDAARDDYVAECVTRWGRIDAAFLGAGILGPTAPLHEYRLADYDRVMSVNVRGVWLGTTRAMAAMRAQPPRAEISGASVGSIVIVSSTGGLRGSGGLGAYVASKHAVVGIMKTAAIEGGPYGIRVNAIHPGPTDTQVWTAAAATKQASEGAAVSGLPQLYRVADPREIARMAHFLLSEHASFCTGGSFVVDGGLLAGPPYLPPSL